MILKMHSVICKYFWTTLKRNSSKHRFWILLNGVFIRTDRIKFQYYWFILTAIDTKLYKLEQTKQKKKTLKYICAIKIDNKALKIILLPQISNLPEVVFELPDKFQSNKNNPTVTYQFFKTIRNKISNYNETANSIYINEKLQLQYEVTV